MVDGLTAGRTPAQLEQPWAGSDVLFASQRIDGTRVSNASYSHSTFVNVSFKDCELVKATFLDCTFIDCYFRDTELRESSFVGCRFVDCQFPKVKMTGCDFRYARFDRSVIEPGEMRTNLPREPNLREELAVHLAVAAEGQGRSKDARMYRLWAIEAKQQHLASATRGENSWYQKHFAGFERFRAGLHWLASRANGWLWGHGEKWHVLARNLLIMTLGVFPTLFWLASDGLDKDSGTLNPVDYIAVSLASVLSATHISTVELADASTRWIAGSAAFAGIVSAGLFITILFRAVTRR